MLDASYITQRKGNLTQANSFFKRLNVNGTPNTIQYGPLPGIYDSSIINNVTMGNMSNFNKTNGCTTVSYGCPCPINSNSTTVPIVIPGEVNDLFVYLGSIIITWSPPSNASGNISYKVKIYENDILINTIVTIYTSYIYNDYTENNTYKFSVTASNELGEGPSVESDTFLGHPVIIPTSIDKTLIIDDIDLSSISNSLNMQTIYISNNNIVYLYNNNTFISQQPTYNVSVGGFQSIYNSIQNLPNSYGISSIIAIDKNTIFIAYFETGSTIGLQGVWKSINGGLSWNNITTTIPFTNSTFVNGAHFWDNNNGIIYGDAIATESHPYLLMYWTNNGGQTWNLSSGINCELYSEGIYIKHSISVIDDTIWYLTKNIGIYTVYKSIDKGHNFSSYIVNNEINNAHSIIRFSTLLNGIISARNKLYYTTNGGENWNFIDITEITQNKNTAMLACIPNTHIVFLLNTITKMLYRCNDFFTNPTKIFTAISNIDNLYMIDFNNLGYGAGSTYTDKPYIKRYNITNIPTVPTFLNITPKNQNIVLLFNPSIYFPTNSITIYTYSNEVLIKTNTYTTVDTTTNIPSITITELTNGVPYTFRAKSTNDIGDSPLSDMSNIVVPLLVPPDPVSKLYNNSIRFGADINGNMSMTTAWIPNSDNGFPITGYKFTANSTSLTPPSYSIDLPPYTLGTLNITNWWKNSTISIDSVYIQAINVIGISTPRPNIITIPSRDLIAKAPIISAENITSTTFTINVQYNSTYDITNITGYIYEFILIINSNQITYPNPSTAPINNTISQSITLFGLSPNTTYQISVCKSKYGGNVSSRYSSAGSNILTFTTLTA
jgi:hypothetical protein